MNAFALLLNLPGCLAATRWSELAPEYREIAEPAESSWWAMGVLAIVVLVVIGLVAGYGLIRHLRVPALTFADDLTLELCRAHGIGLTHRVALDHVARFANVTDTAALFLSSAFFDQAVARADAKKRLRGRRRDSLYEARRIMFPDADLSK